METDPSGAFEPQDFTGLIGSTLTLFFRHFGAFLAIGVLPAFAVSMAYTMIGEQSWPTQLLLSIAFLFLELLIWSATILLTAGAVLGHVPDFATAYRCALRSPLGTLMNSTLLAIALMAAGTILFIVPGLVVLAQTLLAPVVVVMERTGAWKSLRRSRALGEGFHTRNLIIVVVLTAPAILASILASSLGFDGTLADVAVTAFCSLLQAPGMLATPLLYVDARARKEGFGPAKLAAEIAAAYGGGSDRT